MKSLNLFDKPTSIHALKPRVVTFSPHTAEPSVKVWLFQEIVNCKCIGKSDSNVYYSSKRICKMLLARSELPLKSRNLLDMEMLERKVSNVLISKED